MTGIAHQYALAVFLLAKEIDKELVFKDLLDKFSWGLDEETYKFFAHPKISKIEKREMLEKVVEDKLLLNFLKVLVDNDRFSIIQAVVVAYQVILDELNKVMKVKVYSKKPLTKTNLEKISKKLQNTYNRNIKIEVEIENTIIGGFRIEFEGNVIDETINKQLDDLKSSLSE